MSDRSGRTDTSEAGLKRLERVYMWSDDARTTEVVSDLIAALRTAQADLAEVRGLLEKGRSIMDALMGDSDLPDDNSPEMVWMQQVARHLQRTAVPTGEEKR